jgi:hypothetical protein
MSSVTKYGKGYYHEPITRWPPFIALHMANPCDFLAGADVSPATGHQLAGFASASHLSSPISPTLRRIDIVFSHDNLGRGCGYYDVTP